MEGTHSAVYTAYSELSDMERRGKRLDIAATIAPRVNEILGDPGRELLPKTIASNYLATVVHMYEKDRDAAAAAQGARWNDLVDTAARAAQTLLPGVSRNDVGATRTGRETGEVPHVQTAAGLAGARVRH